LDTLLDFPVTDDVFFEEGDIETHYLAIGDEAGDSQQCLSLADAFYWLGGYEGSIRLITSQLVAKRVFRDKA
jgi:hypothetical protein